MRFDSFEYLWEHFSKSFERCKIDKEIIKSVFDVNFAFLSFEKNNSNPYISESVKYINEYSFENTEYVAYCDGSVYIFPTNYSLTKSASAVNFSCTICNNKNIQNIIRIMKVLNGNLIIEDYYTDENKLIIEVYDSKAIDILIKNCCSSYNSIDNIKLDIEKVKLLPDEKIVVSNFTIEFEKNGIIFPSETIEVLNNKPFYPQALGYITNKIEKQKIKKLIY